MGGGLLVGCASLGGCGSARSKPDAPVVQSLKISGNHHLSSRQIEGKILTRSTGWWPFATKRLFDPVAWQTDLRRIVRLYGARGYYQAEIHRSDVVPKPPNGVALDVEVAEGQPTKVGGVDIQGLDGLPADDRAAALDRLPIVGGKTFREEDWAAAKDGIKSRLRNRGYAKVTVEGVALVDVATQTANVRIVVQPGRRYKFGDIAVTTDPDARVRAAPVWEQVRIAIPEGRQFSDLAIEAARERVVAMGVFGGARVSAGTPDDATGVVPVEVAVHEGALRTVRLGGGIRIDQARNEVRALSEWTHRDFLGGLRRLTARAEVGWAFIPTFWAVASNDQTVGPRNGPIARLRLELEQPRFLGHPTLLWRTTLQGDRTLEQAYVDTGASISTGVVWQPWWRLSLSASYTLQTDYLTGAPISSAATAPLTLGCQTTDNKCWVWLSYLSESIAWDKRDNRLEPRSGFYMALGFQQGGGPLGGNFEYLRVLPEARGYLSFGEDHGLTLSARLRVGELYPSSGRDEDSAVVTRFYAGGAVSMRGFADRRLSPLLEAPAPANPSLTITVPIGGNGLVDGSFEARFSLTSAIRLAAFVDFGQVTPGPVGADVIGKLLWAVGPGVRYLTPVGPIRVDLGIRLPFGDPPPLFAADATGAIVQIPSYPINDNCFGLFGSHPMTPVPDGLCVLHISIGEAF
jgi:translocation and assembly module TamA